MEPTPEQREEYERRQQMAEMSREDSIRSMLDLIESLDEEKLITLKAMLTHAAGADDQGFAQHWIGWINGRLHSHFKICLACGKKHDEVLTTEALEAPGD